jgi:Zn-finger nucleic acid-binding protein
MKCPVCTNVDLLMSERQGIEIDYCPTCRGVWLDRGELDKIIEREQGSTTRSQNEPPRQAPQPREEHREHHEDRGHGEGHGYGKHKKKSFFGELFD